MSTAIIFDTETTGIDNPEVIEAAWIPFGVSPDDIILDEFCQRYRPEGEISYGAMATHNIHPSDLVSEPPSKEFSLPDDIDYLIGHNIDFDWRVVGEPDIRRIDTLALSRKLFPEMDSHSQTAMMYRFFGVDAREMTRNAHAALDDVRNCKRVLEGLIKQLETAKGAQVKDLDHLWRLSEAARIPDVMPFGKHKGQRITDIPRSYINWLLKQPDVDPYLIKALRG